MRQLTHNTMFALLLMSAAFCKNRSGQTTNTLTPSVAQTSDPASQTGDSVIQTSDPAARTSNSVAQTSDPAAQTRDSIARSVDSIARAVGAFPHADSTSPIAANSSPGDAIANAITNLQLSQMKDNNPLKQVAQNMMKAQHDGTRGPDKNYTADYKPEQPVDYSVPVQGNAPIYELQYTGGSSIKGKQDGTWKNIYINTKNNTGWNLFTEGYMTSSALNMKAHSTTLSNKDSNCIVSFNAQYQKYKREELAEKGKYESEVRVQKIGLEKMFGYNCMHIRISYTIKALHQVAHSVDDEWYSTEVPGAQYLSPAVLESHAPQVVQKIMAAGCSGALVKFKSGEMHIQLTSITKKDLPDATFTLPANYQSDKNTDLYGLQ